MGLRKGQKELVENYKEGYCAVTAIPGGGKTHSLTMWTCNIIKKGLNKPGKVLIVTYMNSAVNNFKHRISAFLQEEGITSNKDYYVSTIHGLCLQIIKEKPDLAVASDSFKIIEGVERVRLIERSIDEWRRNNDDKFRQFIEEYFLESNRITRTYITWVGKLISVVLSAVGEFKSRGINPEQAIKMSSSLPNDSILKCSADIYEIYDRMLKLNEMIDFDDMLYYAKKILIEDKSLLEKFQKKYTFVCEDEAQDSNLIQSEILALIANGNFLRVGDSNQAICGSFTNSDFKFFKDFCNLEKTKVYSITQSSRSTKQIIDLANHFVKYVRQRHPVLECRESLLEQYIETVDDNEENKNPQIEGYGIKARVFKYWDEEASNVAFEALKTIEKYPEKTIAILVPSAWKIRNIVSILESKKAPFEELENTSKERNKVLISLGRIIDFVAIPENSEKFAQMMKDCFEISEIYDFLVKYPVEKILYPAGGEIAAGDIPDEVLNCKEWKLLLEKIDIIKELIEFPHTMIEKLILYISEKLEFSREERAVAQKVASDVRYIINQDPQWSIQDLALELLNPKNIFNYFANIVWELKGYQPQPGVITISTYHKAKGLEWDTVFLTGLNYSDFPVALSDKFIGESYFLKRQYMNPRALINADIEVITGKKKNADYFHESRIETISERARLLYVGITRAKEYLYLSGVESDKKQKRAVLPSKYLIELKNYIERARS